MRIGRLVLLGVFLYLVGGTVATVLWPHNKNLPLFWLWPLFAIAGGFILVPVCGLLWIAWTSEERLSLPWKSSGGKIAEQQARIEQLERELGIR